MVTRDIAIIVLISDVSVTFPASRLLRHAGRLLCSLLWTPCQPSCALLPVHLLRPPSVKYLLGVCPLVMANTR